MTSNSSSVRSVIELFCKILSENEVHDPELSLRAEILRQAKFNNQVANSPMWQLLHNGIHYCKRQSLHSTFDAFHLSDDVIVSIKSQLQNWGYLDQAFASLSLRSQDCSRQLLLALGWMVHKKKLFDLIVSRRRSPLHETLGSLTGRKDGTPVGSNIFEDMKGNKNLSVRDQLQVQVLLCGKLHQALKRLYATHQLHTTLTNKIASSTRGVSLQTDLDHLTPVEVLLLKDKQELKKMLNRIEEDNEQLKNLLEWKEKENVFWEWMDSVLSLHIEEMTRENKYSHDDGEDEVYLSVPANIGQDILETRTKLRDLILGHENHIELMEKLVASKKIPKSDLQWMTLVLEREIAQLSHNLLHCGHELDSSSAEDVEEDHRAQGDAEKAEVNILNRQQGRGALKNTQVQGIKRKVQEKIEELEREVKDLQLELKNAQAQHLQKLQVFVSQDPSIICIQPTTLKHLFRN